MGWKRCKEFRRLWNSDFTVGASVDSRIEIWLKQGICGILKY